MAIFVVCIILLLQLQKTEVHPHEVEALLRAKKMMDKKGTIPRFLHNTQVQFVSDALSEKHPRTEHCNGSVKMNVPYPEMLWYLRL